MRSTNLRPRKWTTCGALMILGFAVASAESLPPLILSGDIAANDSADEGSSFDNLDVVDSSLHGKIAILRVGSAVGENNLLSVFAGLKNKTAHRFALELETIYKDSEGNSLNAGSWIAMTLKPHEEKEYRSASISVQAVDFLIRVRRAPDTGSPNDD